MVTLGHVSSYEIEAVPCAGGDRLPEAHALLGECRYRAARDANARSALATKRSVVKV